jgi:ABC-type multidrug transport system permease subunit
VVGTLIGGFAVERLRRRDDRATLLVTAGVTVLVGPALAVFLLASDKFVALSGLGMATLLIAFHYGPCFALAQALVKVRMRGLAASILLLSVNLIGLTLGSWLVGALNDALQGSFGAAAVRYSLLAATITSTLGALSIGMAARFVREDVSKCDLP